MKKVIIAAYAIDGAIGLNGRIPWHIPEDLQRFKRLTLHHPVIMGRTTFQSILDTLGKPLPNRTSLVLTSNPEFKAPSGVVVCHSLEEALAEAKKLDKEVFIAGGQRVFGGAIHLADRLELTEIHKYYPGDTFFPVSELVYWKETHREKYDGFDFVSYTPDPTAKR